MNRKDKFVEWNAVKHFLNKAYAYKENVVVFGKGESREHALKKCEICWELGQMGVRFVTEARFVDNKGRADILVLSPPGCAIEITASEPKWSIDLKRTTYPVAILSIGLNEPFRADLVR